MKYTIITACLNAERFLARSLHSVLVQTGAECEIIVQDGGSSDGTLNILDRFSKRINVRSEPDTGIYDAWNKALVRADGDWALFLGADDFFMSDDILARSAAFLEALPPEVDYAYGALARGVDGRPRLRIRNGLTSAYAGFLQGWGLPFPATFVRMAALRRYGFDPGFKIAGDFDFTARSLAPGNLARIPYFVSFMETGGVSDTPKQAALLLAERARILKEQILPKAALIAEHCLRYLDEADTAEDLRRMER